MSGKVAKAVPAAENSTARQASDDLNSKIFVRMSILHNVDCSGTARRSKAARWGENVSSQSHTGNGEGLTLL